MSDTTTRNGATSTAVAPTQTQAPAEKPRRWDPFAMFSEMESEMERFFGRRMPTLRPWGQLLKAGSDWTPSVDVFEKEGKLVIQAELPGVDKKDIDVSLEESDLVLRGERSTENEVSEDAYYRMERFSGTFYRRLPLPTGTQASDLSAEFKDGILTITVDKPVAETTKPTRVEIH